MGIQVQDCLRVCCQMQQAHTLSNEQSCRCIKQEQYGKMWSSTTVSCHCQPVNTPALFTASTVAEAESGVSRSMATYHPVSARGT